MKISLVPVAAAALALPAIALSCLCSPAQAQLPAKSAPDGMHAISTGGAGRILTAHLAGITDAHKMLAALKYDSRNYFDAPFTVTRAYADPNDQHLQASFTARLKGVPVHGIAAVSLALDDDSNADGTLIFDDAKIFSKTLRTLVARQSGGGSGHGGSGSAIKLTRQTAPDGSCQISLPEGYRIASGDQGILDIRGPHGAIMAMGLSIPCTRPGMEAYFPGCAGVDFNDPARAVVDYLHYLGRTSGKPMQARVIDSKPIAGWTAGNADLVRYSFEQEGTRYEGFGLFSIHQSDVNGALLYCTYFAAPESSYRATFPGMLQAWGTWRINQAVFTARLVAAANTMRGISDIIAGHDDYKDKTEAKVFEAWSDVARDQGTWQNPDTGNRYKIPNSYTNLGAPTQGGTALQAVPLGDL